jgi:hypothetical protein
MREQYEYQLAVAEVFWLNHNNYHFADELVRLLDQGAEPMAYLGTTTDHNLYLNLLAGRNSAESPRNHSGRTG